MKTEKRIQQAMIRLVLRQGYDKTTMEDIAREAGVARSTIYTKWKTGEELFASVLRAEALQLAQTWYALVEVDPEGGSFTGIYRNGLLAIQGNAFARALYTQDRRVLGSFVNQPQVAELMSDRLLWFVRLLEKLQAAGLVRPELDARTTALVAITFRQGVLTLDPDAPAQYQVSYGQIIDAFVRMFRQFVEPETINRTAHSDLGKQILREFLEEFAQDYPATASKNENPEGLTDDQN